MVFDEATSSVDLYTEHMIQRALRREMEARTVILVTHRVSTVREADRIIVLEGGRKSGKAHTRSSSRGAPPTAGSARCSSWR